MRSRHEAGKVRSSISIAWSKVHFSPIHPMLPQTQCMVTPAGFGGATLAQIESCSPRFPRRDGDRQRALLDLLNACIDRVPAAGCTHEQIVYGLDSREQFYQASALAIASAILAILVLGCSMRPVERLFPRSLLPLGSDREGCCPICPGTLPGSP